MNAGTFSGLWYIQETFQQRMQHMMLPRIAAGKDPIPSHFSVNALSPVVARISETDQDGDYALNRIMLNQFLKAGNGDVAVIPLTGTMSRFGMCGAGNEFLASVIELAATEKSVRGMVIKGHTPGGTVDSTELLANAIKNFPKKKIGYVAGIVASAGVFAMSQCDEIIIEDSVSAEIGSIGVMRIHINEKAALDKAGLDVRIFRASESVDKGKINSVEDLTEDMAAEIQSELDSCMRTFKGYVRRGRAGKLASDEVFTGKMYKKGEAMKLGLVDRIGSLQDAIRSARRS